LVSAQRKPSLKRCKVSERGIIFKELAAKDERIDKELKLMIKSTVTIPRVILQGQPTKAIQIVEKSIEEERTRAAHIQIIEMSLEEGQT